MRLEGTRNCFLADVCQNSNTSLDKLPGAWPALLAAAALPRKSVQKPCLGASNHDFAFGLKGILTLVCNSQYSSPCHFFESSQPHLPALQFYLICFGGLQEFASRCILTPWRNHKCCPAGGIPWHRNRATRLIILGAKKRESGPEKESFDLCKQASKVSLKFTLSNNFHYWRALFMDVAAWFE